MLQDMIIRRLIPAAVALALGFAAPAAAQTAPASAPGSAPASAVMKPPPAPVNAAAARSAGKGRLVNADKFTTVAAAQASCPTDTVVWSSLTKSHSFHMPNSRYYGKTKHGAYVCEQAALAAGFHKASG